MTNEFVFILYIFLACMVGITVVISLVQRGMRRASGTFLWLAASLLCWLGLEAGMYAVDDPVAMQVLCDAKIPFVALVSAFILLLAMRFYHLERFITRRFMVMLLIIPAITALISFTSIWHPLLRSQYVVVATTPIHQVDMVRGPWYWVHAAYCYIVAFSALVLVLVQHRKLPSGYRAPSLVLVIAYVITIGSNVLYLALGSLFDFDITLIGMTLSTVFIYVAVASSSQTDLLEIARDAIFNFMDEYVFILDLKRQVVDANRSACRWLERIGIVPMFPMSFVKIIVALREKGATIRESERGLSGTDIYYMDGDEVFVYNLREQFVQDRQGKEVGIYSTLFDITRYRTIIDDLVKTVDIDTLTGLANRKVYEEQKLRHDAEKTIPLCVILGDANGLKQVNDTLGHQQGDRLLRAIARQLQQCCPPEGLAARMGGDEFALFLPGMDLAAANAVAGRIEQALAGEQIESFTPSIALGTAQRTGPEEPMESLLRRADTAMYAKKENDRRHR